MRRGCRWWGSGGPIVGAGEVKGFASLGDWCRSWRERSRAVCSRSTVEGEARGSRRETGLQVVPSCLHCFVQPHRGRVLRHLVAPLVQPWIRAKLFAIALQQQGVVKGWAVIHVKPLLRRDRHAQLGAVVQVSCRPSEDHALAPGIAAPHVGLLAPPASAVLTPLTAFAVAGLGPPQPGHLPTCLRPPTHGHGARACRKSSTCRPLRAS